MLRRGWKCKSNRGPTKKHGMRLFALGIAPGTYFCQRDQQSLEIQYAQGIPHPYFTYTTFFTVTDTETTGPTAIRVEQEPEGQTRIYGPNLSNALFFVTLVRN